MRRRRLLGRIAGASAAAVGVTGLAAADHETLVVWRTDDGTERIPAREFDRRSDTPTLAALEQSNCCDCPDQKICECIEPCDLEDA